VKRHGIGVALRPGHIERRVEVCAAAEPTLCGYDHAGIHVHGGNARIAHMGDQADAARPEHAVFARALHLFGEFGRELAINRGGVNTDLFEQASAHHAHQAAACVFRRGIFALGAFPWCPHEAAGRLGIKCVGRLIFQRLEIGNDELLQSFEPGAGSGFVSFIHGGGHWRTAWAGVNVARWPQFSYRSPMMLVPSARFGFAYRMAAGGLALFAIFFAAIGSVSAQDKAPSGGITVFAPGMVGAGLGVLATAWKRKTGNDVTVVGGSLGAVESAMAGQPGDLVILPVNALSRHASALAASAPIPIGRIPFALAVKVGAAHPDISTEEKFRDALAGKTVAYNDPAGGSIAGVMVEKILTEPNYAAVRRLPVRGNATSAVGAGTAPMAVGVVPEILQVPEAQVAGLVPAALDLHIDLSGAVMARAPQPDMAKAFLAYLTGSEAKAVWATNGIVAQ